MNGLAMPGGGMPMSGMVPVVPMRAMLEEEKRQAEATQLQPVLTGLAAHVKKCFESASQHKRLNIEERLLQCVRQRRGEYDPEVLQEIKKTGGSEMYMMLTSNKCRAAGSWIKDVMFGTKDQAPWDVAPTAEPELSPMDAQEIIQQAVQEAMMLEMQMGGPMVTPEQMKSVVRRMADNKIAEMRERAKGIMERMRTKMEDQLQEGGFYVALDAFIDDLVTFPFAVIKGPVPRRRKRLAWIPEGAGNFVPDVQDVIQLEWDRVDPFMIYWAPHATDVDDGFMIERHQLTRNDLEALIGVEGYDEKAIRAVLDEYGSGSLNGWLTINDVSRDTAQGRTPTSSTINPEVPVDALQYWGHVSGKMLLEWGMEEAEVPDPLKEYPCEVWSINRWVIKAVLNGDPCGHKPYYKTSYECIPGSWAGNGVSDLVRDTQRMCNAAARALHNNLGIASGPQAVVIADRIATGEDVTQMYPWKIWQMTSDTYGGGQKPVEFFMPQSNAQELMLIYEKFSSLADEYSGVPRYMTGDSPAGGAGRTASGMSMLMGNAGKSVKQVIGNIDIDVTRPLIERLYYYNMKYSDDPQLKGDVRVVARGVNVLVAKEQAQIRMNEILNIIATNPIFVQIVGEEAIADLLREVTKPLNMNIVPPREVIRANMLMRQQMQMMQMMAMQQGGGMPPEEGGAPQPQQGKKVMPGNRQRLMNDAPITDNFAPMRRAA